MATQPTCQTCGAPLADGTDEGLCPRCLFAAGLEAGEPNVTNIADPIETEGSVIGPYKLLEQIGEGGFGTVYMAEQRRPILRKVALKIIKLGMDTKQVIARFEAERQAIAMMDHANIAKVFEAGSTETGRPYFVMELVRGVPIIQYCDEYQLTTRERVALFVDVCSAIQHAHQKGIIHRDIKPSNILVTQDGDRAQAKIIDFGIAKATQARLTEKTLFTRFQQFIGTPAYMSPEQAQMSSGDIDTRSDIYSLGVLLYELLTGRTPLDMKKLLEAGYDEIRRSIREEDPPKPSTRLSTLSAEERLLIARHRKTDPDRIGPLIRGDLDWIIMKAMEKDRKRRYETADALAMDLKRHLSDEPVSAAAPSTAYRIHKFGRRHRTALATAVAFALLLIIGCVVASWQAYAATQERRRAITAERLAETRAEQAEQQRQRAERNEADARALHYHGTMQALASGWQTIDLTRAVRLLHETGNYPGRGFEWRYWLRRMQGAIKTFHGHQHNLRDLAFSPNGRWLVTGSDDGTARVWDLVTGEEHLRLDHGSMVRNVAFSPDGKRILTSGGKYGPSGRSQHPERRGAVIWNATTGEVEVEIAPHDEPGSYIESTCFSPDGSRVVCGESHGVIRVCDAATGQEIFPMKRRHVEKPDAFIMAVAYSRQGKIASTAWGGGERDTRVKVWDANSGDLMHTLPHEENVGCVTFSPDGSRLATGSWDRVTRIWDLSTPERPALMLEGHIFPVWGVEFSADGHTLATASFDQTVRFWDAESGSEINKLQGHTGGVLAVRFSPDGHTIATAAWDRTAKLWDVELHPDPQTLSLGPEAEHISVAPDGSIIVFGRHVERTVAETKIGTVRYIPFADANVISHYAYSADGEWIVTHGRDQPLRIWDTTTGRPLTEITDQPAITALAVAPDKGHIVMGCFDGSIRILDVKTREALSVSGQGPINALAIAPDGRWMVVTSGDRSVTMRSMADDQIVRTLNWQGDGPVAAAISPAGDRIAVTGWLGRGTVWDAHSGQMLVELHGHSAKVGDVRFVAGGKRILTGAWDSTVRLWETSTGHELLTLSTVTPSGSDYTDVHMSLEGSRITAIGNAHTICVWRAATEAQVAAWQAQEGMASAREK